MSLYSEFKRRQVFRVGAAYVVTAWLIIQVADTILPAFGFGSEAVRNITVLLVAGFLPALCLAWVIELTPGGREAPSEATQGEVSSDPATRWLNRAIIIVLALAVGFLVFDKLVVSDAGPDVSELNNALPVEFRSPSIVVLPFVNMSDDVANEYFSDGISEELLNLLARIPQLRVISRSSAFSFKGQDLQVGKIAAALGVSHVLEGSVRKAGNRVRVTAQLIDARTDSHLWSEVWDRELIDIFAVQDELAASVVSQLKLTLLSDTPTIPATHPQAYALFLQARGLGRLGSREGYEQALSLLGQVLEFDGDYAPAWDALAGVYLNQASKGLRSLETGVALAREAAEKALSMDSRFAPAHARLGWIAMLHDGNLALAARHYERAISLEPTNDRIIGNAAGLLKSLGRLQNCIALDEWATARDPLSSVSHFNLGGSYLYANRWQEAITSYRTALRLSPDRIGAHFHIGLALLLQGDSSAALEEIQLEPLEVLRHTGEVLALHALGRLDAADSAQQRLIARHAGDAAYNVAYVMAYRGDADGAFAWLNRAVRQQDPGLADVAVEPLFSNIVEDPRWLPFLASIGRAPAQLAEIRFQVEIPPHG